MTRQASATVVGSGSVGPDASADSRPCGHVGDAETELHGGGRGGGQASALDRGEVLAHGVDFVDGRAASYKQAVETLQVLQRYARVERELDQRRGAAGEQEKQQRVLIGAGEQVENGARGGEAALVGNGMGSADGVETGNIGQGIVRRGQDAFDGHAGQAGDEAAGDRRGSFAHGHGTDGAIGGEVHL